MIYTGILYITFSVQPLVKQKHTMKGRGLEQIQRKWHKIQVELTTHLTCFKFEICHMHINERNSQATRFKVEI